MVQGALSELTKTPSEDIKTTVFNTEPGTLSEAELDTAIPRSSKTAEQTRESMFREKAESAKLQEKREEHERVFTSRNADNIMFNMMKSLGYSDIEANDNCARMLREERYSSVFNEKNLKEKFGEDIPAFKVEDLTKATMSELFPIMSELKKRQESAKKQIIAKNMQEQIDEQYSYRGVQGSTLINNHLQDTIGCSVEDLIHNGLGDKAVQTIVDKIVSDKESKKNEGVGKIGQIYSRLMSGSTADSRTSREKVAEKLFSNKS